MNILAFTSRSLALLAAILLAATGGATPSRQAMFEACEAKQLAPVTTCCDAGQCGCATCRCWAPHEPVPAPEPAGGRPSIERQLSVVRAEWAVVVPTLTLRSSSWASSNAQATSLHPQQTLQTQFVRWQI